MYEKVNKNHPDKLCDRIGGAIVDLAYAQKTNPKIAGEIVLGHNHCTIIIESDVIFKKKDIDNIVYSIVGERVTLKLIQVPQDFILAGNQESGFKCGDNGIFRGKYLNREERLLSKVARKICSEFDTDGKYVIDEKDKTLIICQSCAKEDDIEDLLENFLTDGWNVVINPLGYWIGGINTDAGAVNRKLGSDMGRAVTGGGVHFKDCSKADVSLNIYAHLKAQELEKDIDIYCVIGDDVITVKDDCDNLVEKKSYPQIVDEVKKYINDLGGFEKFAEWGLI